MTVETHVCPRCNKMFACDNTNPDYIHSCEYEDAQDVTHIENNELVTTTSTKYQEEHGALATNGPNWQGFEHCPKGERTRIGGLKGTVYQTDSGFTVQLR